ncbi:conserved hypothetical protein [Capnocytophaga canimorsus]|uniref:Tll0287-like domain-containing protein n=1 Tax=Capnocytophaga canimorsus TaxID=28188 RepID=A0A0B7ILK4_9FLAO|nr:conserved hypothetical protein [Capnocytophaga canimorsus]
MPLLLVALFFQIFYICGLKNFIMKTLSLFLAFFLVGCSGVSRKLTDSQQEYYLKLGDSITTKAQSVLLTQVSQQIQKGGFTKAVDFCSEKALPITDSLSLSNKVTLWRITDKNRNPENAIRTTEDKNAWEALLAKMKEDSQQKHLLSLQEDGLYYYKAIPLGMPTCLACHGSTQNQIDAETQQVIQAKYPQDKAIGYQLGQLRGMWKVKLPQ